MARQLELTGKDERIGIESQQRELSDNLTQSVLPDQVTLNEACVASGHQEEIPANQKVDRRKSIAGKVDDIDLVCDLESPRGEVDGHYGFRFGQCEPELARPQRHRAGGPAKRFRIDAYDFAELTVERPVHPKGFVGGHEH